jgi:hypothetical protein
MATVMLRPQVDDGACRAVAHQSAELSTTTERARQFSAHGPDGQCLR